MILVLVGMHDHGFDRLVRAADRLAAGISEKVVIQIGKTAYHPSHAEFFTFTSGKVLEELVREARVVVSHAAAGSILQALSLGKPLVVVPRLKRYGEALDDHQLQLARALAARYSIPVVVEVTAQNLWECIQQAGQQKVALPANLELIRALQQQLSIWDLARQPQRPNKGR